MFNLTKNEFLEKGKCEYQDQYENIIVVARKEDNSGFWTRIKFADKRVTAKVINIKMPIEDFSGGNMLHLDYTRDVDLNSPNIQSGIQGLTELIDRWIDMLYDIKRLEMNNAWIIKENPGMTEDNVAQWKLSQLANYEELRDTAIFSK